MKLKPWRSAAGAILTGALLLTGCGSGTDRPAQTTEAVTQPQPPAEIQTEATAAPPIETAGATDPTEKMFSVQTPYCSFDFPDRWKEEVRIEHLDGEPYTVAFYAAVTKDTEQHIFDLSFDVPAEDALGVMQTEDGLSDIYIALTPYAFEHPEELDEGEMDRMMQLQDYSMDILQVLTERYGFTFLP